MKKKLLIILTFIIVATVFILNNKKSNDNLELRKNHANFIDNHPFQKNLKMSKSERKEHALPPNKYFEQKYLLQMNPATGKTESEKLFALQEKLNQDRFTNKVPGLNGNSWVERGPNNVPGRTRAMMYDPNDPTNKRVFAGGVSGGLWVIDDIEDANASWQRVGIPENLSISSITVDANDSNIFYLGTGESYVQGDVNGNGVWKSTDGGVNWFHVLGGSSGVTTFVNDAVIDINSGSISGSYDAIQTSNFGEVPITTTTGDLVIVNDGSANPTEGCNALIGALLTGKIAIVDRGSCDFITKVKNAQDHGAIGVIVVNSVSTFPFAMGGTNGAITIPAIMMGKAEGTILKNAVNNGTVNVTLNPVSTTLPAGIVIIPGKFHINDIVTRIHNGNTEIYAAVSESLHTSTSNVLGGEIGLYKSIDGGASWSLSNMPLAQGHSFEPNDLLVTSDNRLWITTTNSWSFGDGGGAVFSTDDGNNFTQRHISPGDDRVQIAASSTNPNKLYLLIQSGSGPVKIKKTLDAFATTPSNVVLPDDPIVVGGSTLDFTGNQAFYNLAIAVNPANDQIIYVGGINTFKSNNAGVSWNKTSWSRSFTNSISNIHADVHNFVFKPGDADKGLIGTDGGVFYVNSFSTASTNNAAMSLRGNNYNTTQFVKAAIGQSTTNEKLLAGAQDNGSNFMNNATPGINSSTEVRGGDGFYCFIDKDSQYMVVSNYGNIFHRLNINGNFQGTLVNIPNEGSFVNPAELDDNLEFLFTNANTSATTGTISRFHMNTFARTDLNDALLTRPVTAMKVSPYTTTSTTLMVGTNTGSIFKVTNANAVETWTDLTPEPFDAAFIGSISAINFGADEDEIMVTFHNYGVVNVYFTEDGGITWQNKEGDLPDMPVNDILMNPLLNDEVIIATELGVWQTTNFKDANPNWVQSFDGMQNVNVTSFDLRTADNKIVASTYGRGMFTGNFTSENTANTNTFELGSLIKIYPTVSEGNFTVASNDITNTNMQVFDVNGRRVYQKDLTINNETTISLSLEKGVYIVNFNAENLKESHKIIIK